MPELFYFANDTEALLLLVHLVGDIHQPLHVAVEFISMMRAMFCLDHHLMQGQINRKAGTATGNALQIDQIHFCTMWDKISPAVKDAVWRRFEQNPGQIPSNMESNTLSDLPAAGPMKVCTARQAFTDVRFGKKTDDSRGDRWNADLPADYRAKLEVIKLNA